MKYGVQKPYSHAQQIDPRLWAICPGSGLSILLLLSSFGGHLAQAHPYPEPAAIASPAPSLLTQADPLTPTAPKSAPVLGGTQLIVNGTTLSLPWQQTADAIGIADYGLAQYLGVEMLDAPEPGYQPVRWFSDPVQSELVLKTWIAGGYRFADIQALAQAQGWDIQTDASRLTLQIPMGRIQGMRWGRQTWGDRLVLDLAAPVPWQMQEGVSDFTLTLPAVGLDADTATAIAQQQGNLLKSLKITQRPDQTIIQGTFDEAARPQAFSLPEPNRLVLDIRQDTLTARSIAWAPGLRWHQRYFTINGRSFPVYWLAIDPRQPGLTMRPISTDPTTAPGIAPLITTAQRWQAAAAINGGFFNRNNQYPLGAIRREGEWISGPILSRAAIAWTDTGNVLIDRLYLRQTVTTESQQQFSITAINSGYVEAGIGLYTRAWGSTYTPLVDGEMLIFVEDHRVIRQQIAGAAGTGPVPLPQDGYLLALRSYGSAAAAFTPGTRVNLATSLQPSSFEPYPNIMGGGPLLLKQGQTVLNAEAESFNSSFATQAAPRSAVGVQSNGQVLLVTVHYSPGSRGITLVELAQLMQQLGSVDALNLDGGSSSSLYLGGQLLNRNSRTAARVNNGIGIFMQPQ